MGWMHRFGTYLSWIFMWLMDTISLFIERRNRITHYGNVISSTYLSNIGYFAYIDYLNCFVYNSIRVRFMILSKRTKEILDQELFRTRLKIMWLKYFHVEAAAIISNLKYKNSQSVLVGVLRLNVPFLLRTRTVISENIRNTKDAVMWLWKLHNSVNIRLKGNWFPVLMR